MKVSKEFTFHAAHRDEKAPEGDQCGRVHGHTYRLRLTVEGGFNDRGMVLHGDALKVFYQSRIEPRVEHQDLNVTLAPQNPTMEAVTQFVADEFVNWIEGMPNTGHIHKVEIRLWETPTMFAEDLRWVNDRPGVAT